MKMNPVVHFELPAEDRKRMIGFYSGVFGWECSQMDEKMGNYVIATTGETGESGPKNPGMINGGFFDRTEDNKFPSVVISVEDINEQVKKVVAAGGKVFGEPVDIPGVGLYVGFLDTEGNRLSMLQAKMNK